jgi:hypothetical protein
MKLRKTIERIREIANLEYDAYGEAIHPAEQLEMIKAILDKLKGETHV